MIQVHRARESLNGDFLMNPDREMATQALVLALLVRGRTVLEDFQGTPAQILFAQCLQKMGLNYETHPNQWVLEGTGFQYTTPYEWSAELPEHDLLLLLTLLSKDTESVFIWRHPQPSVGVQVKHCLQTYFVVDGLESGGDWVQWRFQNAWPVVKPSAQGEIPYFMRNRMLLGKLLLDAPWQCEERIQVRDQWSRMAAYFGVPITLEITGAEEMDELARRMARAQGIKVERKQITTLNTVKVLTARDYFVPGDTTEAAALALAATLTPGSSVLLKNIGLNGGRAGFFPALKRLGGQVDITSRRERYGDLFGNVSVQTAKKLVGRRLAPDVLASCLEELPFLAVAACFAEGETILRLPHHVAQHHHTLLEQLAENLKQTGCEVGVYEEGLVLRGREECDAGIFEAHNHPILALALLVLARHTSGTSTIHGLDCALQNFPELVATLRTGTEE